MAWIVLRVNELNRSHGRALRGSAVSVLIEIKRRADHTVDRSRSGTQKGVVWVSQDRCVAACGPTSGGRCR